MASRRKSRELALQMLFQREVGKHSTEHVLTTFLEEKKLDPSVREFARWLFEGTVGEITTLDAAIRDQAEHWRLERMAAVDRNLLRMALFELLHSPETPAAAVINEALELARRYSGADSVEFVNGVLDALRKKIETSKARA
jgi:transcription antitermination protein NusB